MKKIILCLAFILAICLSAIARDQVTRNVSALPTKAQTTISQNFKAKVNHIKIDSKVLGGKEYDVILNDGTEVEFDKDGNWKEIDCGTNAVPSGLIPKAIQNYVSTNYKGQKIVQIEVDRSKYKVELLNGVDLEFDRSGRFLRVD